MKRLGLTLGATALLLSLLSFFTSESGAMPIGAAGSRITTSSSSSSSSSSSGGAQNPDGWPAQTTTWRTSDFTSSTGSDEWFEPLEDVADFTYQATGGYANGPYWQLFPKDPNPGNPDPNFHENTAGWEWWPEAGVIAPDDGTLVIISYVMRWSQGLIDAWVESGTGYGGNKLIDVQMWNAAGSAPQFSTRMTIIASPQHIGGGSDQGIPEGGIALAHVNDGAGGSYKNDGVNTPLNIASYPNQWIWVCHVFDFRASSGNNRGVTSYFKVLGVHSVPQKFIFRSILVDYVTAGTYEDPGRGIAVPASGYNSSLWGYWDNLLSGVSSTRRFDMGYIRTANGWIDPPF